MGKCNAHKFTIPIIFVYYHRFRSRESIDPFFLGGTCSNKKWLTLHNILILLVKKCLPWHILMHSFKSARTKKKIPCSPINLGNCNRRIERAVVSRWDFYLHKYCHYFATEIVLEFFVSSNQWPPPSPKDQQTVMSVRFHGPEVHDTQTFHVWNVHNEHHTI